VREFLEFSQLICEFVRRSFGRQGARQSCRLWVLIAEQQKNALFFVASYSMSNSREDEIRKLELPNTNEKESIKPNALNPYSNEFKN
jgi:hypothetical protein